MWVDYRKLNNVTMKDAYALSLIDEILFSIETEVKIFTAINLFSGFHQIMMNEEDISKTSFATCISIINFLLKFKISRYFSQA